MKTLKQVLDFIRSLFKAWPYLVIIIGWLVSAILWFIKVGQTEIVLSIPLSLLLIIVTLALYPVAKFIQVIVQKVKRSPFIFSGLLWKSSFIGYPRPLCPDQGCGQKVFYKIVQPPPVQVVHPNDWGRVNLRESYVYECPVHGKIDSVPNWPINELKEKAKAVQQKQ
jgi:hypothetical protein